MANTKISDEVDGSPPEGADDIIVQRAATNRKLSLTNLFSRPLDLGLTTPKQARFTEAGLGVAPGTDASLTAAIPSGTATTLHVQKWDATAPSTTTVVLYGVKSILRTAAAAFTLAAMVHFSASASHLGAGSTITTVKGYEAANAIVNNVAASTTYGFWSDINKPTNATAYQLAMTGSAGSYFGGTLSILTVPNADILLYLGGGATHTSASTAVYGIDVDYSAPATATGQARGFLSVLRTVAAVFTCNIISHFEANATVKGATSTINIVNGFYAANAIAVGSTNRGFLCDIAAATNTWQSYMGGTAQSYFGGPVGILAVAPLSTNLTMFSLGGGNAHLGTGTSHSCIEVLMVAPSTLTNNYYGIVSRLYTAAASFTLANLTHFLASECSKGAGSTISNIKGFYASNNIVVAGAAVQGFGSDLAAAAGVYQLNMAGTALNQFTGGVILNTTAAPTVGANQVGLGATVAATASAGAGAAAPATVEGYLIVNIAGTARKIPYYVT